MMKQLRDWFNKPRVDLTAFSSSQVASKIWLVEHLEECLATFQMPEKGYRIWILGGWYGITNFILRCRANVPVEYVRSVDRDPSCESIADRINKLWEWQGWQFKAQTANANNLAYDVAEPPHIVINTSVEHMECLDWYHRIPGNTICCFQGSDLPHDQHVNVVQGIQQLKDLLPLREVWYEGECQFNYPDSSFKRSMIIGMK
jgi:hypothetical protein